MHDHSLFLRLLCSSLLATLACVDPRDGSEAHSLHAKPLAEATAEAARRASLEGAPEEEAAPSDAARAPIHRVVTILVSRAPTVSAPHTVARCAVRHSPSEAVNSSMRTVRSGGMATHRRNSLVGWQRLGGTH